MNGDEMINLCMKIGTRSQELDNRALATGKIIVEVY